MPRMITIAAVQMDVKPAPTKERLERAEVYIRQAAGEGAELAVLPELFNSGYAYTDENYARAEPMDGLTVSWLASIAHNLNLHLAGTLLICDGGEIYNRMLVVAPDGHAWAYDKNYPFAWERRYFTRGRQACVAHTALGDLGLMICVDSVHLSQWRRYAGQVDMIVTASCPPHTADLHYHFSGGEEVTIEQMGPLFRPLKPLVALSFTRLMSEQAAWLGVPAVNTVGCGTFDSPVPDGWLAMLGLLPTAPRLLPYLFQSEAMTFTSQMLEGTRVVDGTGRVLAERLQALGEGYALATVTLSDQKPVPGKQQPHSPLPAYALWVSDGMAALQAGVYRKKMRDLAKHV